MKGDAEKVVDLRHYREWRVQAAPKISVRSSTAPISPAFVAVPIPFLVPIPVMWLSWCSPALQRTATKTRSRR
jgi:hypothetical protein